MSRLKASIRRRLFSIIPLITNIEYAKVGIKVIDEWLDRGKPESQLTEKGRAQSATLTKDELRLILNYTHPEMNPSHLWDLGRKLRQSEGELRPKAHTHELWRESMRIVADEVNDELVNWRGIDLRDQSNPWRLLACANLRKRADSAYLDAEALFEKRLHSYKIRRRVALAGAKRGNGIEFTKES